MHRLTIENYYMDKESKKGNQEWVRPCKNASICL
jgi:hypothetical protein